MNNLPPTSYPADVVTGDTVTFDFADLTARERYKLLIGAVVPRPIALVTTIGIDGVINAAPFSFFNCLSADPAILALGVEFRPSREQKDTGRNVRETKAFTVNIVSDALLEAMNICAVPFPPGVDELQKAGLSAKAGVKVPCPWIAESPVAFECRHHSTLDIGSSREIILGEVVFAHIRSAIINTDNLHINPAMLDAVGRMGGNAYASTRGAFDLKTMSVATWEEHGMVANLRTTVAP
jgi:flavin reductase (DIM6/NTAB) family NADH-FMN oxidoreductase RutF